MSFIKFKNTEGKIIFCPLSAESVEFRDGYLLFDLKELGELKLYASLAIVRKEIIDYYYDMIREDKDGFIEIVGETSLIQWAFGDYGGPGHEKACSLKEWVELASIYEEEYFGELPVDIRIVSSDILDKYSFSMEEAIAWLV
jgi:hypothetical protein